MRFDWKVYVNGLINAILFNSVSGSVNLALVSDIHKVPNSCHIYVSLNFHSKHNLLIFDHCFGGRVFLGVLLSMGFSFLVKMHSLCLD